MNDGIVISIRDLVVCVQFDEDEPAPALLPSSVARDPRLDPQPDDQLSGDGSARRVIKRDGERVLVSSYATGCALIACEKTRAQAVRSSEPGRMKSWLTI